MDFKPSQRTIIRIPDWRTSLAMLLNGDRDTATDKAPWGSGQKVKMCYYQQPPVKLNLGGNHYTAARLHWESNPLCRPNIPTLYPMNFRRFTTARHKGLVCKVSHVSEYTHYGKRTESEQIIEKLKSIFLSGDGKWTKKPTARPPESVSAAIISG